MINMEDKEGQDHTIMELQSQKNTVVWKNVVW